MQPLTRIPASINDDDDCSAANNEPTTPSSIFSIEISIGCIENKAKQTQQLPFVADGVALALLDLLSMLAFVVLFASLLMLLLLLLLSSSSLLLLFFVDC